MKGRVTTVLLMALAFVGGVWANENYDIGNNALSSISDVVDSAGSSGTSSVDSAKTELREIEKSRNREATRIIDTLNDNALVSLESELGKKLMKRACDVSRSLIREDKRMVKLMRFINEEIPTREAFSSQSYISPVTVSLLTADQEFLSVSRSTKTFTADELEENIADREWHLDTVC